MRKKKQTTFLNSSLLVFLFFISPILIAQNHISIAVLSNGGEKQSNANYTIVGTVGQVGVDLTTTSSYQVQSGFWNVYYQDVIVDIEDEEVLPIVYKLEQNYPNPFNPSTVIKFAVPERCIVLIKIYDILGNEILTLVNEEMESGWYQKVFNASGYSSGMYIYRMQAGNYVSTKKMLLVK
jgi:hypothetical protein